jgi:hypothetical protein
MGPPRPLIPRRARPGALLRWFRRAGALSLTEGGLGSTAAPGRASQKPTGAYGAARECGRTGMADIVNLNQVRKAKARRRKEAEASANRAKFGRTKAERLREEDERTREERAQDGRLIERDDPNPGEDGAS